MLTQVVQTGTHLKLTAAKQAVEDVLRGDEVKIIPHNVDKAFELAEQIRKAGFDAEVDCRVAGWPLPYLVGRQGKIAGSQRRDLNTVEEVEGLLGLRTSRLIIAGFGEPLNWVPNGEKFKLWKRSIKPQLIDRHNTSRRNDYPLYVAAEWVTEEDIQVVLLYKLH